MTIQAKRRGPNTEAGRAVASRNALKHGMTSNSPVMAMERESEWRHHFDGIIASLAPEGMLEEAFAERVALLLWRLDRVAHYETAVLNRQVIQTESDLATADAYLDGTLSKGELPEVDPDDVATHQHTRVIPGGDAAEKIMRYETHLHRLWVQTLHELEALQARRRGERTHLARLDISSPPA
jgi:hypothetical protein